MKFYFKSKFKHIIHKKSYFQQPCVGLLKFFGIKKVSIITRISKWLYLMTLCKFAKYWNTNYFITQIMFKPGLLKRKYLKRT